MSKMLKFFFGKLIVWSLLLNWTLTTNAIKNNFLPQKTELLLVTVATDSLNDGLKRLTDSANEFDLNLTVFGTNEEWLGGDMKNSPGGAQKIRILRKGLEKYRQRDDLLLLIVDAYDVIVNARVETIVQRFFEHFGDSRIVFGAESFCWPDMELASQYPIITFGERFLNSGIYMGFAADIFKMLEVGVDLKDNDDDQLFFTHLYLDADKRAHFGMSLDHLSRIFQNMNGIGDNINVEFTDGVEENAEIFNNLYNTHPVVIHGNGPSKLFLNSFGNYIAHRYNRKFGCVYCQKLDETSNNNVETTLALAIFVSKPTPYVEEFLSHVKALSYPKNKIHLFVFNNQEYNKDLIAEFVERLENHFASVISYNVDNVKEIFIEHSIRDSALIWAAEKNVDYLLMLDADVHLTKANALESMLKTSIASQIGIYSPLIGKPGKLFTNFWGAISGSGYYLRSADYQLIAEREILGIWNVPFVNAILLISREKLNQKSFLSSFSYNLKIDADMSFAQFCRENTHFLFVDNRYDYGFLVESEHFENLASHFIHRELYDYPNNKQLWQKRYIHTEYFNVIKPETEVVLACTDVYDFPFVSERFCNEIVEIMETYGKWSDGKHSDERLAGGYENVPTRDVHMNQVGFSTQWLQILDDYVAPLQEKVFIGYYERPVKANMMFVVRYRPDEQPSLRPHHDASTYSIDIALNRRGIDYEGGGVRYIRYNCTVEADKIGWSMLFPGRLTHLHEGLPTTKGTRYILVSFINP